MTIKLLVAIQGSGGVEIPAGTEVTLTDAVEAAHVSANKAVYTMKPSTFNALPASGVGLNPDYFTAGNGILSAGRGKKMLPRLGQRRALRIFDGRINATHTIVHANGPGETFQATFELAAPPDMVWPIVVNGGSAAVTLTATKAAIVTNANDLNANSATWVTCNVGGASGNPALPAAPAPGITPTLFMTAGGAPLNNPTRSKIVSIRAFYNTAADVNLTVMGQGADGATDNFTNWSTREGHRVAFRNNVGDCITTPSNFISTTNKSFSPIIGVAYVSQGRVMTAMCVGDSTESGRGTYLGSGPIYEALRVRSPDQPWEIANLSWSGSDSAGSLSVLQAALSAGLVPDIVVRAIGSPNDVSTSIPDAQVASWRSRVAQAAASCSAAGCYLVNRAFQPANSSIDTPAGAESYGSDDAKRVAFNAEMKASSLFFDYSTPVSSSSPNANGQIPFASGMTSDSIHQNNSGINAQASEILDNQIVIL